MNPYHIQSPAMIQVSGGRTSAFMLKQILDAHGGTLPPDVIACFQNTGKEHEATLVFLREIEQRWNVPLIWLEYQIENPGFRVVDFCNASRNGEPFADLITKRKMLPNPISRFCTAELKIRTGLRFAKSLGWRDFDRVIGLRADEPHRANRIKSDSAFENIVLPMVSAKHTIADVHAFWKKQDFDLVLPGNDNSFGNCDLCFLKSHAKIQKIIRSNPNRAMWWADQEEKTSMPFRVDRPPYRIMLQQLQQQQFMFDDNIDDDTLPCMCHD